MLYLLSALSLIAFILILIIILVLVTQWAFLQSRSIYKDKQE